MNLQPVDKLEIHVIVDNVTDNLSTIPNGVTHEIAYLRKHGMKELSGDCLCCGAHGLSLLITVTKGALKHTVLFDAGPDGQVFKRNVNRLNINLSKVEDIILSHGHWDHAGGFLTAIDLILSQNPNKHITFQLNPAMFFRRGTRALDGHVHPFKNIPTPEELKGHQVKVVNVDEPRLLLDDLFYLSGEIARVTEYEKGFPEHVKEVNGCWESDPWIMDERFLAVNVKDKGLVVFSACSHAGIINVLTHAQKLYPTLPLYAVMGGFHLSGATVEKIIPQTVHDLKRFNLNRIIPAHCTGFRAVTSLVNTFGDDIVVPSAVGRVYHF